MLLVFRLLSNFNLKSLDWMFHDSQFWWISVKWCQGSMGIVVVSFVNIQLKCLWSFTTKCRLILIFGVYHVPNFLEKQTFVLDSEASNLTTIALPCNSLPDTYYHGWYKHEICVLNLSSILYLSISKCWNHSPR